MLRTRGAALVIAVLLVIAGLPGLTAGAIPDNRVTITDTTVSPGTPTAGAPTTVSATVRLSAGSASAATLERVEVVDGNETLGAATGLGSLTPGETLSVPVTVRFDEPGSKNLTVLATVSDVNDTLTTVRRPLSLVVESGVPQVETDLGRLVAGVDSPGAVVVSNPTTAAIRNVSVELSGIDGERTRRTIPTLGAGATQTLNFSFHPTAEGTRNVTVDVAYTTAVGTRAAERVERSVEVVPLSEDVGVRVERSAADQQPAADGGGGGGLAGLASALGGGNTLQPNDGSDDGQDTTGVAVTVTNFGNAPIRDAVVVPQLANGSMVPELGRIAVADSIAPGESASVSVDLSDVRASTLRFAVEYDLGDESREVARPYDLDRSTGAVSITGLNLSVDGDELRIAGNLGNVGDGEIRGVVVGVGGNEYVVPTYPGRDQFIGTVGPSEFAPFELTAEIDAGNATNVPVEVAYTTAGERRTTTIDAVPPAQPDEPETGLLGGFRALDGGLAGLGLGVLVTVPLVVFGVRRYR
ncbi:hypothetical protein [Halolamina litorea]|uniref:CARDB protein n=1 Tax=Halolamina litorea TaxID=1515593 RepID=A0ABD6BTP4_9EURY|nr:hypothetical protein [Halolamina litorea]